MSLPRIAPQQADTQQYQCKSDFIMVWMRLTVQLLNALLEIPGLSEFAGIITFLPGVVVCVCNLTGGHTVHALRLIFVARAQQQISQPAGLLRESVERIHVPEVIAVADEWRHSVQPQAFLEHDEPADAAIAVGKRVHLLKHPVAHGHDERVVSQACVRAEHAFHELGYVCSRGCGGGGNTKPLNDFVVSSFVAADVAPRLLFLAGAVFENGVKTAHQRPVYRVIRVIEHVVERVKMVGGFNRVVYADLLAPVRKEAPGFENLCRLRFGECGTFHMVRVVRHEDLRPVEQCVADMPVPLGDEPILKSLLHAHYDSWPGWLAGFSSDSPRVRG